MGNAPQHRSQVILRMPVDYVDVKLVLHDGEGIDAICFVPPGESLERHLVAPEPFMPVMAAARIMLVARATIACATVTTSEADGELPVERQRVAVKLRSGTRVDGELRFPVIEGKQRTADHANGFDPCLVIHGAGVTHHVVKAHIATIEELES